MRPSYGARNKSERLSGLAVAVAAHVAIVAVLLQFDATRSAIKAAIPITVRLLAPPGA